MLCFKFFLKKIASCSGGCQVSKKEYGETNGLVVFPFNYLLIKTDEYYTTSDSGLNFQKFCLVELQTFLLFGYRGVCAPLELWGF